MELYTICLKNGITRNEFIYELDIEEGIAILKQQETDIKLSWLQTKYICYMIVQTQSTKTIKFDDFMKMPWDDDKIQVEVTEEEKKHLLSMSNDVLNKINKINE